MITVLERDYMERMPRLLKELTSSIIELKEEVASLREQIGSENKKSE